MRSLLIPYVILILCLRLSAQSTGLPEGYSFPAEFKEHKATWLSWPHKDTWGRRYRNAVESVWVEMVRNLQTGEEVHILVPDAEREKRVQEVLYSNKIGRENLFFHHIPTDDVWMRDMGPYFVSDGEGNLAVMLCEFNGWGDEDIPYARDRLVGRRIANLLDLDTYGTDMILEGGAVTVNGAGTLITTEYCLLHESRNPDMSKEEATEILKAMYGVSHVVWLPGGAFPDDMTEGHIDGFCKFIDENTLVYAINWGDSESDTILEENLAVLREAVDQDGNPFEIILLDGGDGNFYIANEVVLVPTVRRYIKYYEAMMEQLRPLFPDKRVVGIDCTDLYKFGGAIHCVTQQQPRW